MKQQCHLSMIYFTWVMYLGGIAYLLATSRWAYAAGWLISVPLFEWYYIRNFPRFSPLLGYGKIADEGAAGAAQSQARVTFYTALGCPFCPLILIPAVEPRADRSKSLLI